MIFPSLLLRRCLLLALAIAPAAPAEAADRQAAIIGIDTIEAPAALVSIDAQMQAEFRRGDESFRVPASEIVAWGRLADLRGRETVVLTDGSLLSGSVARIDGSGVHLEHSVFDPVEISRGALRGVVLRRPADRRAFDRLLTRLSRDAFEQDALLLENGDALQGILVGDTDPQPAEQLTIAIETEGTRFATPLDRVTAVVFRSPPPAADRAKLQMGLRQGDLLHVATVTATNRGVGLELAGGLKLTSDPQFLWEEVVFVHGDNRRVVALSALPPVSYKHIPLIGWETPLAVNASAAGGRMRSGGGVIASGLGMPGSSRVAFALDGNFRRFQAELAIDEAAGLRGSVRFRVFIRRGSGDFDQVFQSEVVRGGHPPVPLRVDLNEASLLVLIVDHADRGDELDYANWLHARLVR